MELTRRRFLGVTGATAGAALMAPKFAFGNVSAAESPGDVVVLVFLRGGMDGLSLIAPADMASYQNLRPDIRVRPPSEFTAPAGLAGLPLTSGGSVSPFALSGSFYLHPQASALHDTAWADGNLAVVHAAGMPASESDTRSHFSSQRNWEVGSGSAALSDGFLNRYLAEIGASSLLPGVAHGSQLSQSLVGAMPAFSIGSVPNFGVSGFADNANAELVLENLYAAGGAEAWRSAGAETLSAIDLVRAVDWSAPGVQPANGAAYSRSPLGRDLAEVAAMVKADLGMRVATVSGGGWDTHSEMGAAEDPDGLFSRQAADLSANLAAFYTDLGSSMGSVTLVAVSEFGRTINQNSNGGTDHGRGSAMLVMGNNVTGGVHGAFVDEIVDGPEGDLEVLNDYRTVVAEVLTERGGAGDTDFIFPTWSGASPLGICA